MRTINCAILILLLQISQLLVSQIALESKQDGRNHDFYVQHFTVSVCLRRELGTVLYIVLSNVTFFYLLVLEGNTFSKIIMSLSK